MNIDKVEILQLKIPLKDPFETSFGTTVMKDFLLVSTYGGGEVGYGESVAMSQPIYNEETTQTVLYMLREFLIPLIFSSNIESPHQLSEIFKPIRRNNMAKSVLEGAVWDLYAKQQNISLSSALGGVKKEIEVGVSVGIEPTIENLLKKIERFLSEGYKKIKVKIKPGWDVTPIQAIRKTFGGGIPLMADANSAYSLEDINTLKKLDDFGLMMIEQPLAHDDIIDHGKLQRQLVTPICLDESIHSTEDARKAIELQSCKIINIKVGRVGGLTEAKNIHDLCATHQIPVWCGGMLEAGVGRAHNIAIASLGNFSIPGDTSASNRYWKKDIVEPEINFVKPGIIDVPESKGIGYKINDNVIKQYEIHRECLVNTNQKQHNI